MSAPVPGPDDDTIVDRRRKRAAPPVVGAWLGGLNEGMSAASLWLLLWGSTRRRVGGKP